MARNIASSLPVALPPASVESLDDRAREQRIAQLRDEYLKAANAGAVPKCHEIWQKLVAEISRRSPVQVARMEQARGLSR